MITQRRPLWTTALLASLACTAQSFDWGYSRPGGPAGPHRPGWPPFNGWPGLGPGSGSGSGSGDSGDSGVQIEFCSSSSYAASEYCPEDNPIGGAGTCGNFTVGPNVCYTWSDFPNANDTLEGDVKYMYIPNSTEITTCGLYKTTNCTVGADLEWDSCDTGSTDLVCRKHLYGDILSWNCTS